MTAWIRPNLRDSAAGTITVELVKNHVDRASDIPRIVNQDWGWFKTRHSLPLMYGSACGDRWLRTGTGPGRGKFGGDEEGWVLGCGDVLRDPLPGFRAANGCQCPVKGRAGLPDTREPSPPDSEHGLPKEWRLQIVPVGGVNYTVTSLL